MVSKTRAATHWRTRLTVDACMMVKNEAKGIEKALDSILPHVDHIHIIDTGSTDDTVGMCNEYPPDKVTVYQEAPSLYMTVEEDGMDRIHFSKTRNRSLIKSKAKWLVILDGDEYFEFSNEFDLKEEIRQASKEKRNHIALRLFSSDDRKDSSEIQIRIIQGEGKVHYDQPIHNELVGCTKGKFIEGMTLFTSYKREERGEEKQGRAKPMLLKLARENPARAKYPYYLQVEELVEGNYVAAQKWSKLCIALSDPATERHYASRAWSINIECELRLAGIDFAERMTYQALALHPHCPDLVWLRVIFALARLDLALQGAHSDSKDYFSVPQASYLADLPLAAKALGVGWPIVNAKRKADD